LILEAVLEKGCFGYSAWKDTFYRDIRAVKDAFTAAGLCLAFSRNHEHPGYYLVGQPVIGDKRSRIIAGSVAEVDRTQIAILKTLSIRERIQQGCSLSDVARRVVAYRIMKQHPHLNIAEANRLAVQRTY
jgi:hypothetical protein